jgi:stearoyl-CoA desaturase (Delta-9 desaturase)
MISFLLGQHLFSYNTQLIFLLIWTYVTLSSYSIYVHRYLFHKQMTMSVKLQHFFRFWLWINTYFWFPGSTIKTTAIHRKHHIHCDGPEDSVSVKNYTIWQLIFSVQGKNPGEVKYIGTDELKKYGDLYNEPKDKFSKFYKKHTKKGVYITTALWTLLFGVPGFILGLLWPKFLYMYAILTDWGNHTFGYGQLNQTCQARNFTPIALFEGLHANHHAQPGNPNNAFKWYEFDLCYWQMRLFQLFGLLQLTSSKKT